MCLWEHVVGTEEVGHGGVGMESEAKRGRARGEPGEEGEERRRREGERVEGDEVGHVMGREGWEDSPQCGVERVIQFDGTVVVVVVVKGFDGF